jgi:AcrR family transcriptional regulator
MPDTETRTGRPRDPGRDEAILNATLDLLGEAGYERVTVRAIAQRAGAGLATLYRRWPTKEELVVDAVDNFRELPKPPDLTDDPVENIVGLVSALLDVLQGPRRGLIPALVGQLPHNPLLAETLRSRVILPALAAVTQQLRAVPEVDPDRAQAAAEMIPGALMFQVLLLGRTLSTADVRHIVDRAIRTAR